MDTEVSGEWWPGFNLVAGYTYNSNANKVAQARYSSRTPRHLFKLWGTYRLPGTWSALDVGGGVTAQSAHFVAGTVRSYNDTSGQYDGPLVPFEFSQGSYAVWNARAGYQVDDAWSLSLNLNNILDKTYYKQVGSSANGNWYGEPVNWMLTLRGRW